MLQEGGAPEYIYHDRTAWLCAFFLWAKIMDVAKDIHKEMVPIWAAFLCGYRLLRLYSCAHTDRCASQ
jgi:hypothetical protein